MAGACPALPLSEFEEHGQFQAPGQVLPHHEPEHDSRPSTPKFWRLTGFLLSPGRSGGGGGAAASAIVLPQAPPEHLEATGRPLSRQSSLTSGLLAAAQQQPGSPRLAVVKTPRAAGGGGRRPKTPGRCSSSLALHIRPAPGGGPVRAEAAAGGDEHALPFVRHRSFSLPVPVHLRRICTSPGQLGELDLDHDLLAAAEGLQMGQASLQGSMEASPPSPAPPSGPGTAASSWQDHGAPGGGGSGSSSERAAAAAEAARRLFQAQAEAASEHAQVQALKAALRKERERVAYLEGELERLQLERGFQPPPAAAPAARQAAPPCSPLAEATLPAAVPLALAASPADSQEAAAGDGAEQELLPMALSGMPEESSWRCR